MKFLLKKKTDKIVLVISDLHLGAGEIVKGKRNPLEDFHFDKELVEFLEYYSSEDFSSSNVELIINGDFFDFLAVPFVNFFDDEYWSEKAALEKLKIILEAHQEVIEALGRFITKKNKKILYIIGNHDAEFVFQTVREYFLERFPEKDRKNLIFFLDGEEYIPSEGVVVKHGHDYEKAHQFDLDNSIVMSDKGEKFFHAPWGSFYVTRIVNKFKEERSFINAVRPIRTFIIYGLIFDTLFTLRFIIANIYYFFMVIFLTYFKKKLKLSELVQILSKELELFKDYETLTREYFYKNPKIKVLIVGHTHEPTYRLFPDGTVFINTGTWTKMFNLDFSKKQDGHKLTYAQIKIFDKKSLDQNPWDKMEVSLNIWKGRDDLPYASFH